MGNAVMFGYSVIRIVVSIRKNRGKMKTRRKKEEINVMQKENERIKLDSECDSLDPRHFVW